MEEPCGTESARLPQRKAGQSDSTRDDVSNSCVIHTGWPESRARLTPPAASSRDQSANTLADDQALGWAATGRRVVDPDYVPCAANSSINTCSAFRFAGSHRERRRRGPRRALAIPRDLRAESKRLWLLT
jgi:hypothetical protein